MSTDGRDDGSSEPGGPSGHRQDDDAAWQQIVAIYGEEPEIECFAAPSADPRPILPTPPAPQWIHGQEDEQGYVPPPPPPVPRPVGLRLVAWLGIFGVPILVLVLLVTGSSLPGWGGVLCLAWFVGGFAYLVATMGHGAGSDEGDDGARI